MNEIPEEIRKMFPNQPIHKLDIDEHGDLHVLASAEPLSQEPDFENMPIEQIDQYLREHGYDPEQVRIMGKILTDALIENIKLTADLAAALKRAEAAEAYVKRLEHNIPENNLALAKANLRAEALQETLDVIRAVAGNKANHEADKAVIISLVNDALSGGAK